MGVLDSSLLVRSDALALARRAAATLEVRALARGLAATVPTPEGGGFNDDLAALGPPALAARLAPLTGPGPWASPARPAHATARDKCHNRAMRFFNTEGPVRPDDGDRWRGRLAIPRCGIAGALTSP